MPPAQLSGPSGRARAGWAWRRARRLADCVPLAIEITEPMPALAVARLHWALKRADGEPVYDFTAVYTLGGAGDRVRIVAIAHDQLPRLQAAVG